MTLDDIRRVVREEIQRVSLPPQLFTLAQAARLLNRSARTIQRMVDAGELRRKKVRGKWLIPASEIARVAGLERDASAVSSIGSPLVTANAAAREAKAMAARGREALRSLR